MGRDGKRWEEMGREGMREVKDGGHTGGLGGSMSTQARRGLYLVAAKASGHKQGNKQDST